MHCQPRGGQNFRQVTPRRDIEHRWLNALVCALDDGKPPFATILPARSPVTLYLPLPPYFPYLPHSTWRHSPRVYRLLLLLPHCCRWHYLLPTLATWRFISFFRNRPPTDTIFFSMARTSLQERHVTTRRMAGWTGVLLLPTLPHYRWFVLVCTGQVLQGRAGFNASWFLLCISLNAYYLTIETSPHKQLTLNSNIWDVLLSSPRHPLGVHRLLRCAPLTNRLPWNRYTYGQRFCWCRMPRHMAACSPTPSHTPTPPPAPPFPQQRAWRCSMDAN